ncbi:phage gp6-like head-tail connector protein [Salmonella enterica subsp. enterica serovar Typhimurium]|nr:phage gp6-like head-tail connector protein [Salmonella enterica subsp. enterica serovar Typhimurium]
MTLLEKVKANLILEHDKDDELLEMYIDAAISYAESYQHLKEGYYNENVMSPVTKQAVIMLSSHFYESRDGSTGGFFADTAIAGQQARETINNLLRLDKDWKV